MIAHRHREETINTQLATLISTMGVDADAETIHVHGRHRPDVLFTLRGLRVVLEGKFDDVADAEQVVLNDARKRVNSGFCHIAVSLIYPSKLRTTPTSHTYDELKSTNFRFQIISEAQETEDWLEGNAAALMGSLRRAQEALVKDDFVKIAAKRLADELEAVARLWIGQTGACDRLSSILGMKPANDEKSSDANDRRDTAARVSALVLANAYIFQEQLARTDPRVDTLRTLKSAEDVVDATSYHWNWIWNNINYVPIFQLGERVLEQLPAHPDTASATHSLLQAAQQICNNQAALRHDLMGRIYHWLLYYAKFLGTYYTSTSAATLLLKTTLSMQWDTDFTDIKQLAEFKIGDLACGTGTLLMAAAQAVTDKFINERAQNDLSLTERELGFLHQTIMQNMIFGYDVLPSAVHLTASTLALLAPEVAFRSMNLYVMPMGLDYGSPRLGSLDLLQNDEVKTQFALDDSQIETVRTGAAKTSVVNARVPRLDLCVMNPPFVSSRYGNRLFGSLPAERSALQKELSRTAKEYGVSATAGLGAVFVPLADKHTKPGGRIAFVLPMALCTGEAWAPIRKLVAHRYHLEMVISSHDARRPNFSENTDLSEVLFVARKIKPKEGVASRTTAYVCLWRNPGSIHEALDLSERVTAQYRNLTGTVGETRAIRSSGGVLGELTFLPSPMDTENWTGALFAQSFLMRFFWMLNNKRKVWIPGQEAEHSIQLCQLGQVGDLGYDARDIADAFQVDRELSRWSPYKGFWDHDAKKVRTIAQTPNTFLHARNTPAAGRPLKNASSVWSKAGRILLVSRLRTNTQRVLAVGHPEPVLGNTWWSLNDRNLNDQQRKAILLWLNSTLGIICYYGRRAITEGAWMQMKKPAWRSMLVLDVFNISETAVSQLALTYDDLSERELHPIAELDKCPTREKIDEAICDALELPDLSPVRELLAREPGLTAREI